MALPSLTERPRFCSDAAAMNVSRGGQGGVLPARGLMASQAQGLKGLGGKELESSLQGGLAGRRGCAGGSRRTGCPPRWSGPGVGWRQTQEELHSLSQGRWLCRTVGGWCLRAGGRSAVGGRRGGGCGCASGGSTGGLRGLERLAGPALPARSALPGPRRGSALPAGKLSP